MLLSKGFSVAIKIRRIIVIIMTAGLISVPQVGHASSPSGHDEGDSLDGVVRCIGSYSQYHCIEDPSFDGFGICIARHAKWCTSQLLTTSKEEDVIILVVMCYCQSDTPSILDSAGLNYTLRVSYVTPLAPGLGPGGLTLGEYFATAGSPLTSDNITIAHSIHSFLGPMQIFAIHPGETKTVFDSSPSLPITVSCGLNPVTIMFQDCPASAGRLAHDFVIAITAINDAGPCPASSGFSELVFDGSSLDIDYRIVRESESNVTFTCSGTFTCAPFICSTDPIAMVLDAISLHPGNSKS